MEISEERKEKIAWYVANEYADLTQEEIKFFRKVYREVFRENRPFDCGRCIRASMNKLARWYGLTK